MPRHYNYTQKPLTRNPMNPPCLNCPDRVKILQETGKNCHGDLCPHGWNDFEKCKQDHYSENLRNLMCFSKNVCKQTMRRKGNV